jgi:hypothetical protein
VTRGVRDGGEDHERQESRYREHQQRELPGREYPRDPGRRAAAATVRTFGWPAPQPQPVDQSGAQRLLDR